MLLDEFEEGLRTEEVRAIFSVLQPELTALVAEHADADGDDVLSGSFAIDAQDACRGSSSRQWAPVGTRSAST